MHNLGSRHSSLLLARIDVRQQVVPADNAAFGVPKREATRLFFKRSAEILEHLAVDVLDPAFGRHDRDETGNRFDDQPKAFDAGPEDQPFEIALGIV
jgi:hypothetical protein